MKKLILVILVVLLVFGLCSCKENHRKLQFDDGTSYCFKGCVSIKDDYICWGYNTTTEYVSIAEREFIITSCDCENINKK